MSERDRMGHDVNRNPERVVKRGLGCDFDRFHGLTKRMRGGSGRQNPMPVPDPAPYPYDGRNIRFAPVKRLPPSGVGALEWNGK